MTSLDHVGFVTRSLADLRGAMQRLGFATTEPRELRGLDAASGQVVSLGQWSCHAVFAQGYVELTAVASEDPRHHLAAYLARGPGLHILALGTERIAQAHARCVAAGIAVTAPARATRRIEYGERHGDAAFDWFMLAPDHAPEGLLCFAHNRTPELVYQPEVMQHPNGVIALEEVVLRADPGAGVAARYAQLLGATPQASAQGQRFALGAGGALTISSPQEFAARFGLDPPLDAGGRFAAVVLRVADRERLQRCLAAAELPVQGRAELQVVAPPEAGGAVFAFR